MNGHAEVTVVTGAGGFLGAAVLRALSERAGGRVVGCVRRPDDRPGWPPGTGRIVADLAADGAADVLRTALGEQEDVPVRLILLAGTDRPDDPGALFDANVRTTLTALEAFAGRVTHVVHAGTVAVYGNHRRVHDGGRPTVAPDTCYGRSKWLVERAVRLFARDTGVPAAVLRLSSLYGRGNRGGNAVAALTGAMVANRPFLIRKARAENRGDGGVYARDYLWVGDAAAAVVAASRTGFAGDADAGSGRVFSPRDLADAARASGHRVTVHDRATGAPVIPFGCDPGPLWSALGLPPPRELGEGIADELAWRGSDGGA